MNEITSEQIADMANVAMNAAEQRAEELGLPWVAGYLGIMRAEKTVNQMIGLLAVLGPDGVNELGKAIEKAEIYDMHKQADDLMKGDGVE